jgi:pantothenate kinase
MARHRDPHRSHQQLMTKLDICLGKIKAQERIMKARHGKVDSHDWESLVRILKRLQREKEDINRKIKELPK